MKRIWNAKQIFAVLLAFVLAASGIAVPMEAGAAAKPRLNKRKATIYVGGTVKLKVLHKKKSVKWSSSKKAVASVSKSGLVKGKKEGTATITARTGGKKFSCKVTVKAKTEPSSGTNAPGSTAPAAASPTTNPSAAPTNSPSATPTNSPGNATATPPGQSGGDETPPPGQSGGDETPPPAPTGEGPSGGNGLVASHQVPSASASDTLTVGNMSVTLGMTKAQVETGIGAAPNRTEKSPLGFDVYIYNPSRDYTNYLLLQFDQGKVVGMSTISNYFTYEDMLTSGEQTGSDRTDLTGKGFSSMRSKYDYEAGYMYTGDKEYILAFVDHQGSGKVYGVEILAQQTSKADGVTDLDALFKAEKGIYSEDVNMAMAKELFDFACAFRAVKRLNLFQVSEYNGAQKHSDYMASINNVSTDSGDGKTLGERFDQEYGGAFDEVYFYAECNALRSIDAFGFVTWLLDDTDSGGIYEAITKEKDKYGETLDLYLSTGFTYLSSSTYKTFATLDIYAY